MARPTKLDRQVEDRLLVAIRSGCYLGVAAAIAGIDASTLRRWMASERPIHRELRTKIRQAEAEAEAIFIGRIGLGAVDNPAAAMKFLSRRFPARWGDQRQSLSGIDPLAAPAEPGPPEDEAPRVNFFEGVSEHWLGIIISMRFAAQRGEEPAEWFERHSSPNPLGEFAEWHPIWMPQPDPDDIEFDDADGDGG